MSEFSSLLASFKQNAATASSNPPPSSRSPSRPTQQTRKRPHPSSNNSNARSSPASFPSFHTTRRNKDFQLSFLVIGAQKAGTSWLHTLLQKCNTNDHNNHHARISLPREQKEIHFWDWHYRKGFDWYVRQFDFPPRKKSSCRTHDSNSLFYGEITPCYIVLPSPAISEIHKCFPNLKIIFVARDLVDRAWSAMIMELRDQNLGLQAGEFADGTFDKRSDSNTKPVSKRAKNSTSTKISVAQRRRLEQQSSPTAQPDSYYLERLRSETHSSRSDYATHLRNWYNHFPSESILIVDYRDIESNPRDVLLKIVTHIGVEETEAKTFVENLSEEDVKQRVNAATNTKSDNVGKNDASIQMAPSQHSLSQRPHLRKQMEKLLRPNAVKFNSLLKEKGYSWKLNEYNI